MPLPRPIQNSLLPLLLVFAAQKVCGQLAPADDFFNSGAQLYISNNIPAALEKTEDGLKIYPNDDKLQKLEKLLKQQQQNQQSQSQQQQSQSQQNPSSQKSQQQNQQQQSQQNSQEQKKSDEQKQAEQQKSSEQKSNDKENQNGENQSAAGQMTPEEAKRLLDAQKGDEQVLQMKPQSKPQDNLKPVKDW